MVNHPVVSERRLGSADGPDPARASDLAGMARELHLLRCRAARATGRSRVSVHELARLAGIPKSTLHAYLTGARVPSADALERIVRALDATAQERGAWAACRHRVLSRRHDDVGPAHLGGDGQPVPRRPAPQQLPVAPRLLHGRAGEIAQLDDHLARATSAPSAVIVVTGPGGIGKTALVLHWAHQVADRFPDGQIWMDLRGFGPTESVSVTDALERLLRAMGIDTVELPSDVESRAETFRTAVAGRRMLMVLDNARDSAQVLPLLSGCPDIVSVVTSRDELHPVATRVGAERVQVTRLSPATSHAVLAERASPDAAAALTRSNIVTHCDGLPLALQIVRERLSNASAPEVDQFAAQLDRDARSRLEALDLNDTSVDVSVRGAMQWSYHSLPPDAAALFRRLPLCLVPTFDLASAGVIADRPQPATRRLMDRIVAANLLDVVGPDRYRIHDLVSTLALERLELDDDPDEVRAARIRLMRYLAANTEPLVWDPYRPMRLAWPDLPAPDIDPTDTEVGKAWVLDHADQMRAAMADALRCGLDEYGWLLAERVVRALWTVAEVAFMRVPLTDAAARAFVSDNVPAAIMMSRHLGVMHGRLGSLQAAEENFCRAIEAARRDPALAAGVYSPGCDISNLATVWVLQGNVTRAIEALTALVRDDGVAKRELAVTLLTLTDVEIQCGELDSAAEHLQFARNCRDEDDRDGGSFEMESHVLAARIQLEQGSSSAALATLDDVTPAGNAAAPREYTSQSLSVRSRALLAGGAVDEARTAALDALDAARAIGGHAEEVEALCVLGEAELDDGDPHAALALVTEAATGAREAGLGYGEARSLVVLAEAFLAVADEGSARSNAAASLARSRRSGYRLLAERAEQIELALRRARASAS